MRKWMRSAGLLLIWPLVVFAEGVGAGDTFSGICGVFGVLGLTIGIIFPIFITMSEFASVAAFVVIGVVYLVVGILVHLELYGEWRANILRLPIHQ